ncbi:VOC family protein [bacterium]|nr:VOC family protein [bacterium]
MERVTGIGGIFFKANDKDGLLAWYRDMLGLPVDEYGCVVFHWNNEPEGMPAGQTVWSIFPGDTKYFSPGNATFMVNLRVRDLDAMLRQLREKGAAVDERVEESEFGKFGWVVDPEGHRIELWQPPPAR